jgi:putative ABC transport system substrate-binding protein
VSYAADRKEIYQQAASYVDRILRWEKAGELPFQQPTRYQFTINLNTAKSLGLEFSPTLIASADLGPAELLHRQEQDEALA